jgi:hypothetical protein
MSARAALSDFELPDIESYSIELHNLVEGFLRPGTFPEFRKVVQELKEIFHGIRAGR